MKKIEIDKTSLNKLKILIEKNKKFLDEQKDINGDDDKKNSLAISMAILEEYFKVSFKDACQSLVDDSGDSKIDAFYYNSEGELSELVLIQSKYKNDYGSTGTFSEDEIILVLDTAKKIINGEELFETNEKLEERLNGYRQLLRDNDNPPLKITVFFATNGVIHKGHKSLPVIDECEKKSIYCQFIDATEFGRDIIADKGVLKINLKETDTQKDSTDIVFHSEDGVLNGIIATCCIKDLIEFYKNTGKRALLEGNVRFLLKKSTINKEIIESFKQKPDQFCFFNNGVYILCKRYQINPTGEKFMKVELEKPTVINGGQTIAVLYDLYDNSTYESQFEKANIIVRICSCKDEDMFLKISKATNSQNKIDIVDLRANDIYQNKVKDFFSKKGIGLITKTGEEIVYYDDTINNEYLLQLYTALYEDDPALAKASKKTVFKRFFDDVFSEESIRNNISNKLYRCYEISNYLYSRRTQENKSFLEHARYSIIYAMKCLDSRICDPNFEKDNFEKIAKSYFEQANNILDKIVKKRKDELCEKFSLNNLFKSKEIKSLIEIEVKNESKLN